MKVYIDRLPKCCEECPCCNNCMDYGCSCNLDDIKLTYDDYANKRHKGCPLQSITDYTKQVCEKIREFAYDTFNEFGCFDETDLEHILDQIENEKKESN